MTRPRGFIVNCLTALIALPFLFCSSAPAYAGEEIFAKDNLVAWCIVPFDSSKRTPEERAAMLEELGLTKLAYDWRAEHVPEFEREILALKKHGIEYFAFWNEHEDMFKLFEKYGITPQVWKTAPSPKAGTQAEMIEAAAKAMTPLVERTRQLGCKLGLYNHGGWGGEPENLVAVCERLRKNGNADHVGIVYNFHHAHERIDDFEVSLKLMLPYLLCVNLNGMEKDGEMILPLGEGDFEAGMMKIIADSRYSGPIGILGHRKDNDAADSLRANIAGMKKILKEMGATDALKTYKN